MQDISAELFTAFNKVKFHDDIHKYYVDGQQLISVTTLIHKYQDEFQHDYWAERKAEEYRLEKTDVDNAWKFINIKATTKGSIVHNYAENLFNNKFFPYPKDMVIKTFGYDPVYDDFIKTKKMIDEFYRDSYGKLIPIKTEYVIYDKEFGIGGMIDLLVYNVKAKEYQLWDYKTNKELNVVSKHNLKLKKSLSLLDDCQMEVYSLQLGLYKKIIEKYTNIKIGQCYLVWVSVLNDKYEILPTLDRSFYVDTMVSEYVESKKLLTA